MFGSRGSTTISLTLRTGSRPADWPATDRQSPPPFVVTCISPFRVPAYTVCDAVGATAAAVKYAATAHRAAPFASCQHLWSPATEGDASRQWSPESSLRCMYSVV